MEAMLHSYMDFLDQLYWEGYSEQLAQENPREFNTGLNEYFENYAPTKGRFFVGRYFLLVQKVAKSTWSNT